MLSFEEIKIVIIMLFSYMIVIIGWYLYRSIVKIRKSHMCYEPNRKMNYQYELVIKKINDPENYFLYSFSYSLFSKEEVVRKVMRPDIYDFCILGNNSGTEETETIRVEAKEIESITINTYSVKKNVVKISEDDFMPFQWSLLSDINQLNLEDSGIYETVRNRLY